MIFFAAIADLPSPPPPAPYVVSVPAAPMVKPETPLPPAPSVQRGSTCPVGSFQSDGRPCPHPAFWGLAKGSDVPGQTLGSTDAAYGADLSRQVCEAKPWMC